jgi:glycosyltransferase involved in cell wall biosynthesis
MKKILCIVHRMNYSGAPISLLRILKHLDRSRFQPSVLATKPGPMLKEYQDQGINCQLWKERENFFSKIDILRLVSLIRKNRIDIVHVNTGILPAAALAAGLSPAKCVWHLHEVPPKPPNWRWRLARRFADFFIFNSHHTYLSLSRMVRIDQKWRVIYSGVDLPFDSLPPPEPGSRFKIAMVGNIQSIKGQIFMVDTLAQLRPSYPDLELHLVGDCFEKSYLEEIKTRAREKNVLGNFIFHGLRPDPMEIVKDCDLLVHPGLVESLGNAIIEAMAWGKPVVAFDEGGPAEIIKNGETGYLVPKHDSGLLADRIADLLHDPGLRRRMGQNAFREVQERFSAEKIAKEVMDIYNSLLVGKP